MEYHSCGLGVGESSCTAYAGRFRSTFLLMPHCQELSWGDPTVRFERKEKTRPRSREFENAQRETVTSVRKVLRRESARNYRERETSETNDGMVARFAVQQSGEDKSTRTEGSGQSGTRLPTFYSARRGVLCRQVRYAQLARSVLVHIKTLSVSRGRRVRQVDVVAQPGRSRGSCSVWE